MSGDDLTIALFLFGTAIAFGLTAVTLAGWTNRALVVSLFGVAAVLFICSIFWPVIGENWIGLKRFFQALIANYFGFRAIGLIIFLMFCFDFAIKIGWISIDRYSTIIHKSVKSGADRIGADRIEERVFVDVTPAYLIGLLKDRLEIHGQKLVEPYIGKWLVVTGYVNDVIDYDSVITVIIRLDQLKYSRFYLTATTF